jgi:hypothetical protein
MRKVAEIKKEQKRIEAERKRREELERLRQEEEKRRKEEEEKKIREKLSQSRKLGSTLVYFIDMLLAPLNLF